MKDRKQVYAEMEDMLSVVPSMFTRMPDDELDMEWALFKRLQFEEGPIPNKYRELIGLGISAVTKCKYCIFYHTELARLNGASEAEIEDALHYAKSSVGWSAYISGLQIDFEQFKAEISRACNHVRQKNMVKA
jgi:AhpD family alkylhydroperoxidase